MSEGKSLLLIGLIFLVIAGIGAVDSTALSPGEGTATGGPDPVVDEPDPVTDESGTDGNESGLDTLVQPCAATPPEDLEDPENGSGVIGWVEGYWYNESLDMNATDGLTEEELKRLSARTAARFEALRCLNADGGLPPVEILTREEFQDRQSDQFDSIPGDQRAFDNTKLETMLIVGSEADSVDEREQNRGATVGGSYNFRSKEIRIVTDDPEALRIDEAVLAHELGHAIQDQQFNLSQYSRETSDIDSGVLGLIEGDVHLIEQRYRSACEERGWDCITDRGSSDGDGEGGETAPQEPANWGLYFTSFQPYSDGPNFVQQIFERGGGWDAVNDLYEEPPRSAYFVVKPESYGELELANITVPDRSTGQWNRLTFDGEPDYDTVGIAGISAMFKTPTYESGGETSIYNPLDILNFGPDGEVDRTNPLNYLHPETEGWRDDKLYVYRNSDTGERAAVWRLKWATPADSEPFVESYEEMIDYRGGEPVEGVDGAYEFGPDSEYDMIVQIRTDGDTVSIVTAPSVEELADVHG